ncbi:MAG: hypothetical protein JWQ02_3994 [Capsulimonas sp.]|jgi:DNA processing protein|nr:hypothetical protein [Capsulimonas sp.]
MTIADPTAGKLRQIAWLRLNALEFAPKRVHTLLERFGGSPETAFSEPDSTWRDALPDLTAKQLDRLRKIRDQDFSKELAFLERSGGRAVAFTDPDYPTNLKPLPDAPPVLIVRGSFVSEDKFSVAIVGSRRASSYGLSLARRFAAELADRGLTIVSGGARGVDTQAHLGALDAKGRTIAYLGCGADINYPSENRTLFDNIVASGGAVASEFPLGTRPEPWRFPARNRLISGTALGVLVIESPLDSGSLITAREAGDQGRDVFAIPGPIDTGRSAGCHKLIQDGAKLVQSVDDILEELGVLTLRSPDGPTNLISGAPIPTNLPPEQRRVLELLTLQPRNVDSMIVESKMTAPQVSSILTLLEMRGLARRVPGNAFVRVL